MYASQTTLQQRFIPAGAGNTQRRRACASSGSVYPRWRGEHDSCRQRCYFSSGLSPLARGTQPSAYFPPAIPRFIPAGAGNTSNDRQGALRCPVYPRWRGEHEVGKVIGPPICGLSPLARGTRITLLLVICWLWFIPAGAGNTRGALDGPIVIAVYPRWRGEHSPSRSILQNSDGLSPLARGTRLLTVGGLLFLRFIPAGAGNTANWFNDAQEHTVYPRWRGEHSKSNRMNNNSFF